MKHYKNDMTEWWVDDEGKYHRDGDLPAISTMSGSGKIYYYYKHGKMHRENGSAIVLVYETKIYEPKIYYWMDKQIQCSSDEEWKSIVALKAFW